MLYSIFIALFLAINAWAAPPVQAAGQTLPKEDTRKILVVFGDSLSAGYGVPQGQSYPDDLQRTLDAQGYQWRVVNLGISGDTTSGGLARVNTGTALRPAMVLLELGGNDGLGWPARAASGHDPRKSGSDHRCIRTRGRACGTGWNDTASQLWPGLHSQLRGH